MDDAVLLRLLLELAEKLGIEVRQEDVKTEDSSGIGGLCRIEDKYILIIHSKATMKEKFLIMIEALRQFELGDIYVRPALRELLEENKEYSQAVADFNRAIEIAPKYSNAYYIRGVVYGEEGNYQQAIRDINKAIELDSKVSEAYASRGDVYSKLGDSQQAMSDWKTAAKLGHKGAQNFLRKKGVDW